jgi:hypothetical protein
LNTLGSARRTDLGAVTQRTVDYHAPILDILLASEEKQPTIPAGSSLESRSKNKNTAKKDLLEA